MNVWVNGEKVGKVVNGEFYASPKFLDFLDYKMPHEKIYNACHDDLICKVDKDVSEMADFLGLDWAYKWINFSIDTVGEGIAKEWSNFLTIF